MPTIESAKVLTKSKNLYLRVSKGHFATSHSHINYYIDVAMQKTRLSEAKAVAKELVKMGVPEENIIVEGKGGVADVKPSSYNRRVIIEVL